MLKGLKKSKGIALEEEATSRVRSSVNENSIKAQQIIEEQE